MQYAVGLLFTATSEEADFKDVVRASDVEDAIRCFMKGRNLRYAYAAYVYPIKKHGEVAKEWRWNIQCSVSGQTSMFDKKPC